MGMYSGMLGPNVSYGSETWEMNVGMRRKVDVFEISYQGQYELLRGTECEMATLLQDAV